MDLHDLLQRTFGFPRIRPGQAEALSCVLAGRDALVVMPTGSGKSLIYQLAATLLPGVTLVISPLVSLMKDQADGLARRNIPATFINSTLNAAEHAARMHGLMRGDYKIVLVAPERLRVRAFQDALARITISQLAIDEAHCISQWGHDFRPDYMHIAEARARLRPPVTLALTATATPRVQTDIVTALGVPSAERVVMGFNRPNLALEVLPARDDEAKLRLLRGLLANAEGAGIVYAGTRAKAEEVAEFARAVCGVRAETYHAGLDAGARSRIQDAFMSGDLPLVAATNAFGMGIDRPDVRFVAHFGMPGTLEAYYQEAGRAGRDGLPARAVLLYSPKDSSLHEFFIENNAPSEDELRALHAHLLAKGRRVSARLPEIEMSLGMRSIKLRVSLDQLEAAGALRRAPDSSFGSLEGEALPLDPKKLAQMASQTRQRRAHQQHLLSLMRSYAEADDCRRRRLLSYFGDPGDANAPICCDNCMARGSLGAAAGGSAPRTASSRTEQAALAVLEAVAGIPYNVGVTKLSQHLRGSSASSAAALKRHIHHGRLSGLRMDQIESLVRQLIDQGYLKQVGGSMPVVRISAKGEDALKSRMAITVSALPGVKAASSASAPARAAMAGDPRPAADDHQRRIEAGREAAATIATTAQWLRKGYAPERIAAERGMTVATVYSHLTRLIADGAISIDPVVPSGIQQQVRAAIAKVGSAGLLKPLKDALPDNVSYEVIRCVVEAWKREHPETTVPAKTESTDIAEQVYQWGESGDRSHVPDLIAALRDANGNARRLAASALGKLRAPEAVGPLLDLLGSEDSPQVRQYAIKALGVIGDPRAREVLARIESDPAEMPYNRKSASAALAALPG